MRAFLTVLKPIIITYLPMLGMCSNSKNSTLLKITIFIIGTSFYATAQNDADSLRALLYKNQVENTGISEIYMSLFVVYLDNYDSATFYAQKALDQALLDSDSLMIVEQSMHWVIYSVIMGFLLSLLNTTKIP